MIDCGPTGILCGEAEEDGWTYGYEMLAVPQLPESISSLIYQPSVSANCAIEAYGKHGLGVTDTDVCLERCPVLFL